MSVGISELKESEICYPDRPPFDPDTKYPETVVDADTKSRNSVYGAVRELFHALGYDREHFGTPEWNPLGWLIKPGETVFLKPNMIAHKHLHRDDWDYVITHGSVIRTAIDYAFIALRGRGRIIVGDAPQTDSDFDKIIAEMGLPQMQAYYRDEKGFTLDVVDLRKERWIEHDGIYVEAISLAGDPEGVTVVDMGSQSSFSELDQQQRKYYGAYYDVEETNAHHCAGKHEYCISRSPIAADVFISIPKLKTHKKCGVTLNLKGLVGINGNKNWLPHYAFGSPAEGGDQFDRSRRRGAVENALVVRAKRFLLNRNATAQYVARKSKKVAYGIFGDNSRVVRSGNWHGNDTVWRMCLDLNRILLYANVDGSMRPYDRPKRYFSIVDGVRAMEGDGPVSGTLRKAGILVAGANPVAVDASCCALMGFDIRKIPLLHRAFDSHVFPLATESCAAIKVVGNSARFKGNPAGWRNEDLLNFAPHWAWRGHIEVDRQ